MIDVVVGGKLICIGLIFFVFELGECGKGGKGGVFEISNVDFVLVVFLFVLEEVFVVILFKSGNLEKGGWNFQWVDQKIIWLIIEYNNFVNCFSFYLGDDGFFRVCKVYFVVCYFLMLDDFGIKVFLDCFNGLELLWLIEISFGNYQGGIIFVKLLIDGVVVMCFLNVVIEVGFCDVGVLGVMM